MPDRDVAPTAAAYAVAAHLAQIVNPALEAGDAGVAAALLQPTARQLLETLAADGFRLVQAAPAEPETYTRGGLTLLQGGQGCHNGTCGCSPTTA